MTFRYNSHLISLFLSISDRRRRRKDFCEGLSLPPACRPTEGGPGRRWGRAAPHLPLHLPAARPPRAEHGARVACDAALVDLAAGGGHGARDCTDARVLRSTPRCAQARTACSASATRLPAGSPASPRWCQFSPGWLATCHTGTKELQLQTDTASAFWVRAVACR